MSETNEVDKVLAGRGVSDVLGSLEVFLTKSDVAKLVGMSGRTLQSMISAGEFPKPDKFVGPRPRWLFSTYNNWARKKPTNRG